MRFLLFVSFLLSSTCFLSGALKPNVLFIAVDDLRAELGCYGANHVVSPNIDGLAASGLRFNRAYCQQAICGPSRASVMTGLRPDSLGVHGNHTHFRKVHPEIVTLPQHFKDHGYHTQSMGKLYHGVFPEGASITTADTFGDKPSWSVPTFRPGPRYYYTEEGIAAAKSIYRKVYKPGKKEQPDDWTTKLVFGPATEAPPVDDGVLYDGQVADHAVSALAERASKPEEPFFLAVGFIKPHSPYIAPKKYFDLYDPALIDLAKDITFPEGSPSYAGHGSGELRRYTDQQKRGAIPEDDQRRVRQAYLACTTYIDAQIGKVLDALENEGLAENTIVVLWSDHGYHLGEKGLWGKTTNYDLDTRVPLIIRAPGKAGNGESTEALVELVDLYPTLADLASIPIHKSLEGKSLVPFLDDPAAPSDQAAFSQYTRGKLRGYAMTTSTHRYVEWYEHAETKLVSRELYDHQTDPGERINLAEKEPETVRALSRLLDRGEGWRNAVPKPSFTLAPIFGKRMVLQRGKPIPIWGTATPGAKVQVQFAKATAVGIADRHGDWKVELPAMEASNLGQALLVSVPQEKGAVILHKDILVGDVWICAGQSNMRWKVSQSANADATIPSSANPLLRLHDSIGKIYPTSVKYSVEQLRDASFDHYYETAGWEHANPKSVASFSAVAYFFGAKLQKETGVPIGLIHNAIGGVPMETYIPIEALESDPKLTPLLGDWLEDPAFPEWCRTRGTHNLRAWIDNPTGMRPHHPFEPGFLFESAMRPLVPMAVSGFLWYQGESNATENGSNSSPIDPAINAHKFTTLIKSWREVWGDESLLFLFPTLPRLDNRDWEPFREVQRAVADGMDGVGTVDIFDLGHDSNVHPTQKQPVGERLAALALRAKTDPSLLAGDPAAFSRIPVIERPDKEESAAGTIGFEDAPLGDFTKLDLAGGQWTGKPGHAEVLNKFAHRGKQSLRIHGGDAHQVIFAPTKVDGSRWDLLSFQAERWTARAPFQFRISALIDGEWEEFYNGDKAIRVGARFLTHVETAIPKGATQIRMTCTSPKGGGIMIDEVLLAPAVPMKIEKTSIRRPAVPILLGKDDNPVLEAIISTEGSVNPLSLENVEISTKNANDLASVRVFLGKEPLGEAVTDVLPKMRFSGKIPLVRGANLLRVVAEPKPGLDINGRIECDFVSAQVSGKPLPLPAITGSPQRIGVAVRKLGQDDSYGYRIPGLATSNAGTLLAVYDNRYRSLGDLPGDIDVGLSRSTDGGQTWEPMKVIMDMGDDSKWKYDGIGDPSILVDRGTGTIWVAATWSHGNRSWHGSGPGMKPEETGQFILVKSDDDGLTWSDPMNITSQIKNPDWRFVLVGPGKGITLKDGSLVFPAQFRGTNAAPVNGKPFSTLIRSTDQGKTWKIGTGVKIDTTEAQLVQLEDGSIMINCRDNRGGSRSIYTTTDFGQTWKEHPTTRSALPEPVCMASLIRIEKARNEKPLLFFSNPPQARGRSRMTIKVSDNEGRSWPEKWHTLIDERFTAYSCMTRVGQNKIGLLYEGLGELYFVRIPITELVSD